MTRKTITVTELEKRGWKPCYQVEGWRAVRQYTLDEAVEKVRAGAKIEIAVATCYGRQKYALLDGECMMWTEATEAEQARARELQEAMREKARDDRNWRRRQRKLDAIPNDVVIQSC